MDGSSFKPKSDPGEPEVTEHNPAMARLTQRPPQAEIDAAVGALAARFGNRLVT